MINLLDLEKRYKGLKEYKVKLIKEYELKIKDIEKEVAEINYNKNLLMNNIDADKIKNAKKIIYTRGCKNNFYGDAPTKLQQVINDVVDNFKILEREYLGCKDYAQFTGQGINCEYGYCPSHGSVVMEIGLTDNYRKNNINKITEDDKNDILYFLNLLKSTETRSTVLRDWE